MIPYMIQQLEPFWADFNASGSAVVLAVARAYAQLDPPPKRSVMFVLFGGEELGLLGSEFFVLHPPVDSIRAMINLDMVGFGENVLAVHTENAQSLFESLQRADSDVGILKRDSVISRPTRRSCDFAPFVDQNIPVVGFFSIDPYEHYHQPSDEARYLNPESLAKTARLVFEASRNWADRPADDSAAQKP